MSSERSPAQREMDRAWRDDMRAQRVLDEQVHVLSRAAAESTSGGNAAMFHRLADACQAEHDRLVAVWD